MYFTYNGASCTSANHLVNTTIDHNAAKLSKNHTSYNKDKGEYINIIHRAIAIALHMETALPINNAHKVRVPIINALKTLLSNPHNKA